MEGVFDVCYSNSYISKAAFCQKIVKSLVEKAMDDSKSVDHQLKALASKQMYTNHEYLNWLQKVKAGR